MSFFLLTAYNAQVAVDQRFEEVAATQGPTTTTTPRPVYQYTYDKARVINEILSVSEPFSPDIQSLRHNDLYSLI